MAAKLDREARQAMLDALLAYRDTYGEVHTDLVRRAAKRAGQGESTWWRYVKDGKLPTRRRQSFALEGDDYAAWVKARGSAAAAWRERGGHRAALAGELVSERTFRRAAAALPAQQRAMMAGGEPAARRHSIWLRREETERNAVWAVDASQADVWVIPPRFTHAVRPWRIVYLDCFSRAIAGYAIVPKRPSSADVLAALGESLRRDPDRSPVFGVPRMIVHDNGLEFVAGALQDAYDAFDTVAWSTMPFTPQHNGKIERLHWSITEMFERLQPYWERGPRRSDRRLYAPDAPPMPLQSYVAGFDGFVRDYNFEHQHRSLAGASPAAVYQRDGTPLREVGEATLRRFLLKADRRTVRPYGIEFRTFTFVADELHELEGRPVEVRYRPHDYRAIEIYYDDDWICTAHNTRCLPESRRAELLQGRRDRLARARADLRAETRDATIRMLAVTHPDQEPELLNVVTPDDPPGSAPPTESLSALLGLEHRRNRPAGPAIEEDLS